MIKVILYTKEFKDKYLVLACEVPINKHGHSPKIILWEGRVFKQFLMGTKYLEEPLVHALGKKAIYCFYE